jgi:hypothetical protein
MTKIAVLPVVAVGNEDFKIKKETGWFRAKLE